MDLEFTIEEQAFQAEVRDWLSENLPDDVRDGVVNGTGVNKEQQIRWQKILAEKGWIAPSWPTEYGGTGWTPFQKYIFANECAEAGAPALNPFGLTMCGPVIYTYGSEEQKAEHLPGILNSDVWWCQGYSEPGSGSDLASLKTMAVSDGDDYIVNGTKIWTTHAQFADHIFCLVRTNPDVKPQIGISFLLIPMDLPGITVEPIITIADDHEVNQVFFDDVRVPQANLVGPENEGWTVAKYLLEFERGGGGATPGIDESIADLKKIASQETDGLTPLIEDPGFAGKLAELEIRNESLRFAEFLTLDRLSKGESPGPGSSLAKNTGVEINQELNQLKLQAVHYYGIPHANKISLNGFNEKWVGPDYAETVTPRFINSRAASIFGGAKEVQKNIIAKVVLGL